MYTVLVSDLVLVCLGFWATSSPAGVILLGTEVFSTGGFISFLTGSPPDFTAGFPTTALILVSAFAFLCASY